MYINIYNDKLKHDLKVKNNNLFYNNCFLLTIKKKVRLIDIIFISVNDLR